MQRWLTIILVALTLALAACGGDDGLGGGQGGNPTAAATGAGNQGGSSGVAATLRYGLWNKDQAPIMERIAQEFKKSHPNINVTVEVTPWDQYWTKLEAAATGGALPDVLWMNGPNIIKYASNDILMPLDEQIKAGGVDMGQYPESLVNLYTVDGKRYAIPKDYDTIGLWYNKELFDAAGVKYPDENWTWDNVRQAAKKLIDKSKGVWGIAAHMKDQEGYYNTIFQNGGYVVSDDKTKSGYDTPETIGGLKFWTDLIKDGSSPTHAQMTETEPVQMFQSGKVAMFYGGSWRPLQFAANENIKDKIDVTQLPKGKKDTVVIHGIGHVIPANVKNKEAAWEFVKFLGSKEAAEIMAKTGAVIPAYSGAQDLWVKSNPQWNLKAFIDQVPDATPFPTSADTLKWKDLETQHLPKAWAGEAPVEDSAKTIATEMNQILKDEQ